MSFDVSWIYQIIDKYSAPLNKIKSVTSSTLSVINKTSKGLKSMGDQLTGLNSLISGLGLISAIKFPFDKALKFEDVMIDVKKVLSFKTPDQFKEFREGIFKTAIKLGKLPEDIGRIAFEGGKLGITVKNMKEFIGVVARSSIAFDILEGQAAKTIGSIKTKFGLTIKEVGKLMDSINFLADNTSASGANIIEVVSRTVGTMKSIKMPKEFVAGWAAFADQMEVSPELAASGLNMMVSKMMTMPGMMKKLLKDPNKSIRDFLQKFANMGEVRRSRMILKKFGSEAGRFVLKAVNSLSQLDKTLKLVGKESNFVGSMMKELEKKMEGAKTAVGKIKAAFDFALISIGDEFLPILKEFT